MRIEWLTPKNISKTIPLCIEKKVGALKKKEWACKILKKMKSDFLGLIAFENGKVLGALEFLPSLIVPYPLPEKNKKTAFITCIYSLEERDCRKELILEFEKRIFKKGFKKISVVSGVKKGFPNGPVDFFENCGFKSSKILDEVELAYGKETLVFMEKECYSKC
ncbi:MAG: hypothetical protein ACE5K0_07860 [Candidatus Methanofastidiosia archaeon]